MLEKSSAKFASRGDDLVLFGDLAHEWVDISNLTVVPLLSSGRVPQLDPVPRQILTLMIDTVFQPAKRLVDLCCFTVPGGHDIHQAELPYDVRFFQQLVALRGDQPKRISPGRAVVLAQLASASFSRIGISVGASNCQIGVIHCGRELASCSFDESLVDHSAGRMEPIASHLTHESVPADQILRAAREQVLV